MVPSVPWGVVELEPEVADWVRTLPDDEFGRVEFYIDLLAERGVRLDEPYTRQLAGKLRELRPRGSRPSRAHRVLHREWTANHPAHRLQ
jgi:hypothetical protein